MNLKLTAPATVFALAMLLLLAAPLAVDADTAADSELSYYNQLDANGRALYDAVKGADAETLELTVQLPMPITANSTNRPLSEVTEDLRETVHQTWIRAKNALWVGEPMAIWLWHGSDARLEESVAVAMPNGTYRVSELSLKLDLIDTCPYRDDPATVDVNERQQKIDAVLKAVDDFESKSTDVRGKVADINRYLVDSVTYDPDFKNSAKKSPYDHDAYGALVDNDAGKRYAVCEGYSKAFQLLADKLGLTTMTVFGTAAPSLEAHAWNYVLMDDEKWYAVDTTWNDGKGNAYFLVGYKTFFQDHYPSSFVTGEVMQFNYPVLSEEKYDSDPASYMGFTWVAYVVIGAIIVAALYVMVRRGAN